MDSVTPRAVPVYGERESIAARINRRPRQPDLIAIMAPIFSRFEEEAVRAQGNRVTKRVRNWCATTRWQSPINRRDYKRVNINSPKYYLCPISMLNWIASLNWKNSRGWKWLPSIRFENIPSLWCNSPRDKLWMRMEYSKFCRLYLKTYISLIKMWL